MSGWDIEKRRLVDCKEQDLILVRDKTGTPYFRKEFLDGLKLVLGDQIVSCVSFVPLVKNTEWFFKLNHYLRQIPRQRIVSKLLALYSYAMNPEFK